MNLQVGASMFALNAWGSYGQQQQESPSKANPRIPSALNTLPEGNNGGNRSTIAQPQARHSNIAEPRPRNHPGTIGTPVHMDGDQRSKSLVDMIQEDFPRTASPMFANMRPPPQQSQQQQNNHYSSMDGGINDGYMNHLHSSMSNLSVVSHPF